jgi:competence protein ComFC
MIYSNGFWDYLKEGFLNLIYPLSCENCGKEIKESKGYAICDNCINQIKFISSPYCYQCGKPLSSEVSFEKGAICSDCHNKKDHFYFTRSVAYYQGVMRKCIHLLKYKKQVKLVQPLGNLMVNYLWGREDPINIREVDLIVPVPLCKEDYLKRGFNQSGLLAKYIADYFSITFSESLLIKNRDNVSQVGLSKTERKNNVRHVYSINSSYKINFSNVLLIDDIYTTGATVEACCRELRKTGVKKVSVLTLARGV